MIPQLLAICISTVAPYTLTLDGQTEHGSMVYRLPPHCAAGMLPEKFGPPTPQAKAPAAKTETPRVTKPQAKKATKKRCKPGRVRDSRGICRRKR